MFFFLYFWELKVSYDVGDFVSYLNMVVLLFVICVIFVDGVWCCIRLFCDFLSCFVLMKFVYYMIVILFWKLKLKERGYNIVFRRMDKFRLVVKSFLW